MLGPLAPRLIAITDTQQIGAGELLARLERLLARGRPGTVMVMLRDRELPVRARAELGRAIVALARRYDQRFSVNDRLDLALLLGADAVHLGEMSVCPGDARRVVGELFISRAGHDPARPELAGADALVLSPVCAPRKGKPAIGTEGVRRARAGLGRGLLYALGGIDAEHARACLAAGADGVAAIGAAFGGSGPESLLGALSALR